MGMEYGTSNLNRAVTPYQKSMMYGTTMANRAERIEENLQKAEKTYDFSIFDVISKDIDKYEKESIHEHQRKYITDARRRMNQIRDNMIFYYKRNEARDIIKGKRISISPPEFAEICNLTETEAHEFLRAIDTDEPVYNARVAHRLVEYKSAVSLINKENETFDIWDKSVTRNDFPTSTVINSQIKILKKEVDELRLKGRTAETKIEIARLEGKINGLNRVLREIKKGTKRGPDDPYYKVKKESETEEIIKKALDKNELWFDREKKLWYYKSYEGRTAIDVIKAHTDEVKRLKKSERESFSKRLERLTKQKR